MSEAPGASNSGRRWKQLNVMNESDSAFWKRLMPLGMGPYQTETRPLIAKNAMNGAQP